MARKKKGSRAADGLWSRVVAWVAGPEEASAPARSRRETEAAGHVQEIKGLALFGVALWLCVSMASYYRPIDDPAARGLNWGGQIGFYLADLAYMATGVAGILFAALGMAWGLVLVARKRVGWPALRVLAALCFVLSVAFLVELAFGTGSVGGAGDGAVHLAGSRMPYGPGGWFALQATPVLAEKFGGVGLWILMVLVALTAFMLATEMAFWPALSALADWAQRRREERGESLFAAIAGWTGSLALGLWNFARGAALDEPLAPAEEAPAPARRRSRSTREVDPDELEEAIEDELDEDEDFGEDGEPEEEDAEEGEGDEDEEDDEAEAGDEEEASDDDSASEDEDEEGAGDEDDEEEEAPLELAPAARRERAQRVVPKLAKELPFEPPTPPPGDWKLPPMELLFTPDRSAELDNAAIEAAARKLEHALLSFRVEAQVVGAQVGPTVILFELEVSQGTRMNKVTQLSQEIAAALRAQSVRIIAPIPGKATIGIEVPNVKRRVVRIAELVSAKAYDKKFAALPLFIGVDAEGQPIVEDLSRMPHLLIAGTTGSGKSVCINTILASVLLTRSPHDVQMILIDPKMVELQMFAHIPHLMLPVVTDMRQATAVLFWAVEKMEGRYELFKNAGVKNLKGYNALSEDELRQRMGANWNEERTPRHVPYIVVVIDEFADLMMASKKEAEQAITRLAQKSRAVGIHVILATQRPSTDVITGVIKGNLPTRIAFQVASKVDSRVILDAQGAEKLLGGGDMLYTPPSSSRIKRVQGALVEDQELQRLVEFVCKDSAPSFNQELVQVATGTAQPGAGAGFESALEDEMWDEAVRVILKSKRGSASLLQRALGIGYTRASRLLDMMGEAGIVSDHKGSKAREVLMTLEDWEEAHGAAAGGAERGTSGDER
jgi:S-DNA-T family DNA segregation ATPase FtsK/SpoIIIE